jgi:hypothetical protein
MGRALSQLLPPKLPFSQTTHPLYNGVSGGKLVSRCPVWITVLKLWFSVWALAVSPSLRGLGSWLVAFVEDKDGKGV